MKQLTKKGFTLIELLVVVLIIGILAAVALPQYFKAVEKSRATEALSIMGSVSAAMERARLVSTNNQYPTTLSGLDIELADVNGSPVSGGSWSSNNFDFQVDGENTSSGNITATRNGSSNYTLRRDYYTGKVTCNDTTASGGASVSGICASLGLPSSSSSGGSGGSGGGQHSGGNN